MELSSFGHKVFKANFITIQQFITLKLHSLVFYHLWPRLATERFNLIPHHTKAQYLDILIKGILLKIEIFLPILFFMCKFEFDIFGRFCSTDVYGNLL